MKRIVMLTTLVLLAGCIDVIKLKVDGGGALVVDGLITNEPGPYTIQLSRSIDFDNSRPVKVFASPEPGAIITISDNTGFSETLVEYQRGFYRTKNIQGVVGNAYSISIQTTDGKKYESNTEVMPGVAPIGNIEFRFDVYDRFFVNANGLPRTGKAEGFYIYAVAADPPGKGNYYRWTADGIYEFFTRNDDPTKNHCWMTVDRLEPKVQVSDDLLYDGSSLSQYVCVIPYDKPWKYLVKMKQQSLTQAAFNYWRISGLQQASTGSLFDPPPSIIQGNISNVNDTDETVLGFFGASAVTRKNLLIDRLRDSGYKAPNPAVELVAGDCRVLVQGATNVKPDGF